MIQCLSHNLSQGQNFTFFTLTFRLKDLHFIVDLQLGLRIFNAERDTEDH